MPPARFKTVGLQALDIFGSIFDSMGKVLKMPCTHYGSGSRANSTPCPLWMLGATVLLPHMLQMVAGAVRKSKSDIVLSTLVFILYTE
jgi:hypothetical protein